ncbi:MAG: hypothetical protein ACOC2E_00235 [Bacteroidota bacterium]
MTDEKKKTKKKEKPVSQDVNEPMLPYGNEPLTFEKVWLLFKETDRKMQETDRKMQETDRKMKETDRKMLETDRKLEKMYKESRKDFKRLNNLFVTQWGKLMEALITPSCLRLFRARGIDISRIYTNVKVERKELEAEFDIVMANGSEVVIVEVKTTFTTSYVDDLLEKMTRIREYLPEHKDKIIYGAVAAIKYDSSSDKYAYKKGLFVLVNSGENILKIANKNDFSPREF